MDPRTIKAGARVPYDARVAFREEPHPESHHLCRQGSGGIEPDDQAPRTAPTLPGHQRHQRGQVMSLLLASRHSLANDDQQQTLSVHGRCKHSHVECAFPTTP
jgi:hypothetical protein